jgi:hypothetical protein
MYRCHFTWNGRVVAGDDLDAVALDEAIREARNKFAERTPVESLDGFEIWFAASLLYMSQPTGGMER